MEACILNVTPKINKKTRTEPKPKLGAFSPSNNFANAENKRGLPVIVQQQAASSSQDPGAYWPASLLQSLCETCFLLFVFCAERKKLIAFWEEKWKLELLIVGKIPTNRGSTAEDLG